MKLEEIFPDYKRYCHLYLQGTAITSLPNGVTWLNAVRFSKPDNYVQLLERNFGTHKKRRKACYLFGLFHRF